MSEGKDGGEGGWWNDGERGVTRSVILLGRSLLALVPRDGIYRCAQPCKRAGTKGIAFTASLAIAYLRYASVYLRPRGVCERAVTSFYREIKGIPT